MLSYIASPYDFPRSPVFPVTWIGQLSVAQIHLTHWDGFSLESRYLKLTNGTTKKKSEYRNIFIFSKKKCAINSYIYISKKKKIKIKNM